MLERRPQQKPTQGSIEIRVPWVTLLKILAAILVAYVAYRLRVGFELLLLAVLLAVALSPVVDWVEDRGLSRRWAVAGLGMSGVLSVGAFAAFVVPPLTTQLSALWTTLPTLGGTVLPGLKPDGLFSHVLVSLLELPRSPEVAAWLSRPQQWGSTLVEAAAAATLVAVVSLYLILDGRAVVAWLLAYVPRRHRGRMSATVPEVFAVVKAYVTGQLILSALFAVFCFVVLTALEVPAALPLALFAGVCDAFPSVGILVAMAAAGLISLAVGPGTAVVVLGLYFVYHQFEAYVLVPRLYGDRLRLSTLTVFLAIIAGGLIDGMIGALLALPIVAAYPVVERHWLAEYLHPDAVEDHARLRAAGVEGSEGHESAVDAVLNGKRPAPLA
jgi:predicted PurR-regulated permease PerM